MPEFAFFLTEGFLMIAGFAVLGGYHLMLYRQIRQHPSRTAIGLSARARNAWVASVIEEGRDILAVQTIRNMLMASSFLASTAILIVVGLLNLFFAADKLPNLMFRLSVLGAHDETVVLTKLIVLITDFFIVFFSFTMSIRYYAHVSFLINVPAARDPDLKVDTVAEFIERASLNYTVGMRGYYLAIPLTLWLFGPLWFLLGAVGLVLVLIPHDHIVLRWPLRRSPEP